VFCPFLWTAVPRRLEAEGREYHDADGTPSSTFAATPRSGDEKNGTQLIQLEGAESLRLIYVH